MPVPVYEMVSVPDRDSLLSRPHLSRNSTGNIAKYPDALHSVQPIDEIIESSSRIRVGLCAMEKKAHSKPMQEILARITSFDEFEVIHFGNKMILEEPVEKWPLCDCLLSWHSDGFPLKKVQKYVQLRHPFSVNDLQMQELLLDRRHVYKTLMENSIPCPSHIVVSRDCLPSNVSDPPGFVEDHDYVEMNGKRIYKPFVEKPVSGEDHNIYIYYPSSMGGGVKRLFRKVDDKSSTYDQYHSGNVRREGSYMYEEFLTTGGTDVKIYTVGPRYAHAEARKSPVVDGKVQRTADGKEVRYPVLLSPQEKEIARMVSLAFGQKVCGFDLLRSERGKSYVCDVNGWSFVKNSNKYYDDAAGILRSIILTALAPHRIDFTNLVPAPIFLHQDASAVERDIAEEGQEEAGEERGKDEDEPPGELRCVLAVIRHGDRTPKQKMKMSISEPALLALFEKYKDAKGKQAKLKTPIQLQEVLDITKELQKKLRTKHANAVNEQLPVQLADDDEKELRERLQIVRTVLEAGGHFRGVNRKVQLKPQRWDAPPSSGESGTDTSSYTSMGKVTELMLVLKWGGVLTHAGRTQAEELGKYFRANMYPRHGPAGGGLLRLHSTYRHDLKIYSSDEGRVQTSAAAFTKGLLDLEGDSLTPILVSLVNKDASMLEAFGKGASEDMHKAKEALYQQLTWDGLQSRCVPLDGAHETSVFMSEPASPVHARSLELSDAPVLGSSSSVLGGKFEEVLAQQLQSACPPGPNIKNLPEDSLQLMRSLVTRIQALVDQLHEFKVAEKLQEKEEASTSPTIAPPSPSVPSAASPSVPSAASSSGGHLSTSASTLSPTLKLPVKGRTHGQWDGDTSASTLSPTLQLPVKGRTHGQWDGDTSKPCGQEKFLLLHDRWRKLLKSFYITKKDQFDISKIPDIYDSAKYDAIHNAHLGLVGLEELYSNVKKLAEVVIANEYGLLPTDRLSIGSKICRELVGKLLSDMANMREESIITSTPEGEVELNGSDSMISEFGRPSLDDDRMRNNAGVLTVEKSGALDDEPVGDGDHDADILHRLCPTYASDVNSPLRHVRTRIYFTSESHIHSLISVLRFCNLGDNVKVSKGLLTQEGQSLLEGCSEFDYLTHIVFRMYENKAVPVQDPKRFHVEISFSPGAAYNPVEVVSARNDHALPIVKRSVLNQGSAETLGEVEELLSPLGTKRKVSPSVYALQVALKAPSVKGPSTPTPGISLLNSQPPLSRLGSFPAFGRNSASLTAVMAAKGGVGLAAVH
ncbi:hypothetical protein CEUSTIGMA_g1594.t1 [Chlamydomonas eustigma]|uniref:Inositol hexakisphosphate and diphosphoinositol-pentakisphosphate kinase n=1 Tax=Chlamydomonas eustigma TaxID=1157962 RepID=A0A250WTK8_9CHLO|nr:hypothetical protein CEUSTIGMA_g1594.t1 [Chlamydomonas eustigma]|eukprot:GAX74145.1 hypothetical protein CEUSTIGMA_g1594.t1 [Chlamydomonas eustigma]